MTQATPAGMRPWFVRLFPLCLAALALLSPACGGGGKNPVSGKVTYKGEPCDGALVVLHPMDDRSGKAARPYRRADADGRFTLTSDPTRPGDGAAPGEYVVAITWMTTPRGGRGGMGGDESKGGEEDRLGGKSRDETVSKLRVTIKSGKNELKPFDLN